VKRHELLKHLGHLSGAGRVCPGFSEKNVVSCCWCYKNAGQGPAGEVGVTVQEPKAKSVQEGIEPRRDFPVGLVDVTDTG